MAEFIDKFKKVVQALKTSETKSDYSLLDGLNPIYRLETLEKIMYKFSGVKNQIVNISVFHQELSEFLDGKSKPLELVISLKKSRRHLFKWLAKQNTTSDIFNKVMDMAVIRNLSVNEIMPLTTQVDDIFGKAVIIKLLTRMGDNNVSYYFSEKDFSPTIKALSHFEYSVDEYPLVKNYFERAKKIIENKPHVTDYEVMSFLKKRIDPNYWSEFAQYCPSTEGLKLVEKVEGGLFNHNPNPVYNLEINCDFIRQKHINLSPENDMRNMIKEVLLTFTRKGESLNIESAFHSHIESTKARVHFLSKDNNLLDGQRIQKIFEILTDQYAQRIMTQNVGYAFLDKSFDYAFIETSIDAKEVKSKSLKI